MTRKEEAVKLFKEGYNCAQAVLMVYCDVIGFNREDAAKIAVGFGNGVSGMQETCGAVSGMVMAASYEIGKKSTNKKDAYPVIHKMAKEFEARQGSCHCGTLLKTKDCSLEDGRRRGCIKCVEDCCDIFEETFMNK